jgi:SAM-dependent methyltransferase
VIPFNGLKFAHFPYIKNLILDESRRKNELLRVLDVGCGPGNTAHLCDCDGTIEWFGLDLWRHQIVQAAEKQVYSNLFQVNLVDGVPFKDNSFDTIICLEVLMYLPNSGHILSELHRILLKGGLLIVYNPISWFPKTISVLKTAVRKVHVDGASVVFSSDSDWRKAQRPSRITYYSPRSLAFAIESSGFSIDGRTGFRLFRNRVRAMKRLENYSLYRRLVRNIAACYPSLASDLLITARKI